MNEATQQKIDLVTAAVQELFAAHDTRIVAAVMYAQAAIAARALVAAGLWTPEGLQLMLEETKQFIFTPSDVKPEIQYLMDGELTGRPN